MGVDRPVTQTEKQAMRSAYEQTYGAIEETVEPARWWPRLFRR